MIEKQVALMSYKDATTAVSGVLVEMACHCVVSKNRSDLSVTNALTDW
jgi:hypothetical protein